MKRPTKPFRTVLAVFALVLAMSLSAGVWFGYGPGPQYDTDNDGIPDWLEQLLGLDPLVTNDANGDVDGDGTVNSQDRSYGNHAIVTTYPVPGERIP